MAEGTTAAVGAGLDVNTAGNPTEIAMAYLQDEVTFICGFYFKVAADVKNHSSFSVANSALFPGGVYNMVFISEL